MEGFCDRSGPGKDVDGILFLKQTKNLRQNANRVGPLFTVPQFKVIPLFKIQFI